MNVKNKRTRIVFARILDCDYAELERICARGSSATISDLVRDAIRYWIEHKKTGALQQCQYCGQVAQELEEIRSILFEMNSPVATLPVRLAQTAPKSSVPAHHGI